MSPDSRVALPRSHPTSTISSPPSKTPPSHPHHLHRDEKYACVTDTDFSRLFPCLEFPHLSIHTYISTTIPAILPPFYVPHLSSPSASYTAVFCRTRPLLTHDIDNIHTYVIT